MEPVIVSPRQYEIARLTAEARTAKQIGQHLGLTPATAKVYRTRLYERLGLQNTECDHAVVLALMFLRGELVSSEPRVRAIRQPRKARPPAKPEDQEPTIDLRAVENERWNRIFEEKFADPTYYEGLRIPGGSTLG